MLRTARTAFIASLVLLVLASPAAAADVTVTKLPAAPAVRPGPEALYMKPPRAPQLENTGIWKAAPILISGASAYRRGEFLYQDYIYDDLGAAASASDVDGSYTYPEDPAYAGNAADLVEVRMKPAGNATAFRLTFNSMKDPDLVGTTIALGGEQGTALAWPHGAKATSPAEVFVTVHGSTGDIVDAATGHALRLAPTVSVDRTRRQIEVRVPRAAYDPTNRRAVRVAVAAGLWDNAAGRYRLPASDAPTAFYNAAFRFDEPPNAAPGKGGTSWMDTAQARSLRTGDLSPFYARVDFTKLASRLDDDMNDQHGGVPTRGMMVRLLASRFEPAQGRGNSTGDALGGYECMQPKCTPQFSGQLQPYGLYVPYERPPKDGYGLVLSLHGATNRYTYAMGPAFRWVRLLGERAGGSIVVMPEARGDTYFYHRLPALDPWEAWADAVRHYRVDTSKATMTGVSMGGYGAYKYATTYPDLFSSLFPNVPAASAATTAIAQGAPGLAPAKSDIYDLLPSLRHIPVLSLHAVEDPLVPPSTQVQVDSKLDALGYRYHSLYFQGTHGEYRDAVPGIIDAHLGASPPIDRDPAHVTYALNAFWSEPEFGMSAGHAYWLSGLKLRDKTADPPVGTADVVSSGFGVGDPVPLSAQPGAGVGEGGGVIVETPRTPYTSLRRDWGLAPRTPVADRLTIKTTNLSELTIDVARARVTCNARLDVTSDGPLRVNLAGCGRR